MVRASIPSMRMIALFAGLLAMLVTLLLAPAAQPAQASHGDDIPVTGRLTDGGTFTGTVSDLHARVNDAGNVVIRGVLNGTATDAEGNTVQVVDRTFRTVLDRSDIAQATCDILKLRLGPLHLDLLGLQVDLNRIVLDITAQQGPGNLLGNLLCAVAGLLDNGLDLGSIGDALANLLNRIFGLIG
jgi:hypothetical protein